MSVTISTEKEMQCVVFFLFFCLLSVALLFFWVFESACYFLLFLCFGILVTVRYWIAIGRIVQFDSFGITVSFLCLKKQYSWDQINTIKLFQCSDGFGYRINYTKGIEFSRKSLMRPSWLKPLQYCIMFHPFSYIPIHFAPQNQAPIKHPSIYEVDRNRFIMLLTEHGITIHEEKGDSLRES